MTANRRAGFSLVELLVALVIFSLVAISMYQLLNVSQRVSRTQTERASLQGNLRAGIQIAMAELQEIWTDQTAGTSAITAMSGTSLSYRAMRGLGLTCVAPVIGTIVLDKTTWSGLIPPAAGQGLYVYDQGDSETSEADDDWHEAVISNVIEGVCPDGNTSYILTVTGLDLTEVDDMKVPGPARTHQAMQFGLIASGGRNWLGMGVAGGALTPLAGPLNATGLLIEYKDRDGNTTATPSQVKSIILNLYGETDRAGNVGLKGTTEILGDTMVVRVQLRNGR